MNISRVANGTASYIYTDHLGSHSVVANASGRVGCRENLTPFGEVWSGSCAANDDKPGLTGHVRDGATGLTYMQARYYDPVLGRFLSTDPVEFSVGRPDMHNRYAYVANDPVNMIDPDGEFANFVVGFVVGAAIDVAVQTVVEGKSLSEVNVGQAFVAGGIGAVSGGLGGGAAKGVASVARAAGVRGSGLRTAAPKVLQGTGNGAVSGGVAGGTQSAITQQLETGQVDLGKVAKDTAFGAAAGAIGGAGSGSAQADASKAAFGDARGRAIFNNSQPGEKAGAAAGVATEGALNAGRTLIEERDQ